MYNVLEVLHDVLEDVWEEQIAEFSQGAKLPRRLTDEELHNHEYVIDITGRHAKHRRYPSYRHRCQGCGYWDKRLLNGLCSKCLGFRLGHGGSDSCRPTTPDDLADLQAEAVAEFPSARAKWW